jgi:hypothetical protein
LRASWPQGRAGSIPVMDIELQMVAPLDLANFRGELSQKTVRVKLAYSVESAFVVLAFRDFGVGG